jgi:transcriptional regulator with XRE-family HTH domain
MGPDHGPCHTPNGVGMSTPKGVRLVLDSKDNNSYAPEMAGEDTLGERIRKAREAMHLTQGQLADLVGTRQQTIGKIETGALRHSRFMTRIVETLGLVADKTFTPSLFPVRIADAPIPKGTLLGDKDLPVLGATEAGSGMLTVSSDPVDYVRRPDRLINVKDAYGLIIAGDSMEPAFEPGDTILIHPHLPPIPNTDVVLYADNGFGEVRTLIKRLVRFTATEWHLIQHNPPPGKRKEIVIPRAEWQRCHRIVGKFCR